MADNDFRYEPWSLMPTIMVHELEPAPKPTGILDQHGMMIHRVEQRIPFGFQPPTPVVRKLPRRRR